MPVRCAHASAVSSFSSAIETAKDAADSVGGCVTCVCRGLPAGWGEPVFEKLEAALGQAMLSIPATKVAGEFCGGVRSVMLFTRPGHIATLKFYLFFGVLFSYVGNLHSVRQLL